MAGVSPCPPVLHIPAPACSMASSDRALSGQSAGCSGASQFSAWHLHSGRRTLTRGGVVRAKSTLSDHLLEKGSEQTRSQPQEIEQESSNLPQLSGLRNASSDDVKEGVKHVLLRDRRWGSDQNIIKCYHEGAVADCPFPDTKVEQETVREPRIPIRTEQEILLSQYIPVYVMLPLDTITPNNTLPHADRLMTNLRALKAAHVDGVMVDVWWGIVEAQGPGHHDWSAYKSLFQMIQSTGLKVQVVMSFHQCGGNTGDSCYIPLPQWVLDVGKDNPDIFFTNKDRKRNQEYLSFSTDDRPLLLGRSALQVYFDFMWSFRNSFADFFDNGLIHEIEVGLGPAGELRFPSYPETHGWRFPGIGEFQCYDRYMLEELREAADAVGQYEWGYSGPHNAGSYNDWPHGTGFFGHQGSFESDYGRFFLEWYSGLLLKHGDRVLEVASHAFEGCKTRLAAKVAGVHWWYNSRNHAAELTAGYYNTRERDGYVPIAKMLKRHDAILNFTCIEMRNSEQWYEARCGPEGLVEQVLNAAWREGVEVSCENALPRYDMGAFDQVVYNARPDGIRTDGTSVRRISSFTFLRLGIDLLHERNWNEFTRFVRRLHAGLEYHPEPEKYFKPRRFVRATPSLYTLAAQAVETPTMPSRPALDLDSLPSALDLDSLASAFDSLAPSRTPSPSSAGFGTLFSPGLGSPGVDTPTSPFDDPFFSREPDEKASLSANSPSSQGPPIDGPILQEPDPKVAVPKWKGDLIVGQDRILPPEERLPPTPPPTAPPTAPQLGTPLELKSEDSSSTEGVSGSEEVRDGSSELESEVALRQAEELQEAEEPPQDTGPAPEASVSDSHEGATLDERVVDTASTSGARDLVEFSFMPDAISEESIQSTQHRTAVLVVSAALAGLSLGLVLAGRPPLTPWGAASVDQPLHVVGQVLQQGWTF